MMTTQKRPLLSIVIPVLNEAANLQQQLEALHPTRDDVEIIVVDGGSTDGSVDIARTYATRVFTTSAGRARQMNLGASHAVADMLVFLHADTVLDDACQQQLITIAKSTGWPLWGHFMVRLTGRHWLLRWVEHLMNLRSRWTEIATGDQTLFVQRSLFQKVGGFPEIALMEDIAISSRLKKYHSPIMIDMAVTTSSRRWERKGVLKTILMMWGLRLAYWCGVNEQRLARIYYGRK